MNNKRNFSEVLEKLQAISEGLEMQIITISSTLNAESIMELSQTMLQLVQILEEKGIKVTDVVLSPRGAQSTISLTCEVNPMLPISKDIRTTLMTEVQQTLGLNIKILK